MRNAPKGFVYMRRPRLYPPAILYGLCIYYVHAYIHLPITYMYMTLECFCTPDASNGPNLRLKATRQGSIYACIYVSPTISDIFSLIYFFFIYIAEY